MKLEEGTGHWSTGGLVHGDSKCAQKMRKIPRKIFSKNFIKVYKAGDQQAEQSVWQIGRKHD